MLFLLWCLYPMISFVSSSEPCIGPSGSASANQYQCWDTNGILKNVQFPLCVERGERCDGQCDCPWCDDEWNCPTFEECQVDGFLCVNSYLPKTNQLWACIPQEWVCDGVWDCPNGEDESSEFCNVDKCANNHNLTYWYQCSDTGRCIDIWAVGNGEIDCVDGEDEYNSVIAEVGGDGSNGDGSNGDGSDGGAGSGISTLTPISTEMSSTEMMASSTLAPTSSPTGRPSFSPTPSPTESFEALYGIDLRMDVLGVKYGQVCTGPVGRFKSLEKVLASMLQLSPTQVYSTCINDTASESHDSSSDSEENEEEEEEKKPVHSYTAQKVIVRLGFDQRVPYMKTLQRVLKYVRDFYESIDSSSDEVAKEFKQSIQVFDTAIGARLSSELRKVVLVEVARVSGNA